MPESQPSAPEVVVFSQYCPRYREIETGSRRRPSSVATGNSRLRALHHLTSISPLPTSLLGIGDRSRMRVLFGPHPFPRLVYRQLNG